MRSGIKLLFGGDGTALHGIIVVDRCTLVVWWCTAQQAGCKCLCRLLCRLQPAHSNVHFSHHRNLAKFHLYLLALRARAGVERVNHCVQALLLSFACANSSSAIA